MNTKNCEPERNTITFLKRNLVYCFESGVRGNIKDQMENFESMFFGRRK